MADFWNDQNRLSLEPQERLLQIMDDLYVPEEEPIWLTNAVCLLLQTSSKVLLNI